MGYDPDPKVSESRVDDADPAAGRFPRPSLETEGSLLDQTAALVRTSDLDGRCDFVNRTWTRFTGRPSPSDLGDGWTAAIHLEDRARTMESWRRHFKMRIPVELEYRLRRADGTFRWILERDSPFREGGRFRGFVHVALDVQKRHDDAAIRERAVNLIAEQTRTPLHAARVLVEVVRRDCADGVVPGSSTFSRLDAQFDRLSRLLRELSSAGMDVPKSARFLNFGMPRARFPSPGRTEK